MQRAGEGELKHYPKKKVYSFVEGGKTRWIDESTIDFLADEGYELLLAAKQKGYSTFAALFVVAHASLESGWGRGNWAPETHNLFSIMGGSSAKYKTPHGTLQQYASVAEGFDSYVALIGRADRWPSTVEAGTGLFFKSSFTPDDVNKAFNQYTYWKEGSGYVYNFDPSSDYGDALFDRMKWLSGPYIVLLQQHLNALLRLFHLLPAEDQAPLSKPIDELTAYVGEMTSASSEVDTKLTEHRRLKASGAIGPKPGAK